MDLLTHELRFAARGLLRRPGFTAVAVGALGLGIGANVALYHGSPSWDVGPVLTGSGEALAEALLRGWPGAHRSEQVADS